MTEQQSPETPASSENSKETSARSRHVQLAIIIGLVFVLLLTGLILAVIFLVNHPSQAETWRDILIIFMALESMIIGFALIVLIIQIARLTALLQLEIKPLLDSTNDTVSTLRGTTKFISKHLVSPVVKVNSSYAALRRAFELVRPSKPAKPVDLKIEEEA